MARGRGVGRSLGCLLLVTAVAQGHHFFGIRLMLMAAAGLAGLYLLHNLAGDFDKLTKPIRPTMALQLFMRPLSALTGLSRGRRAAANMEGKEVTNGVETGLRLVLQNDPLGCARKYICHIANRPPHKLSPLDRTILRLVKLSEAETSSSQDRSDDAHLLTENSDCFSLYPLCFFTGQQLERIMSLF